MIQNKFELIPFLQLLLFQLLISKLREKRREINQKLYYINQKKKKKKKINQQTDYKYDIVDTNRLNII